MDKYNMHLLGWKQFEDLSGHIMQYVLGMTYTPFATGKDGGRDGYFVGTGELRDQSLTGKFVFQCKHTTKADATLKYTVVKNELQKIARLVSDMKVEHYVVLTNYNVPAEVQAEIELKFTDHIKGLKTCLVFGAEWFNLTIDYHKNLRRLVPRLYGIGDLGEILDDRVLEQSKAILEELKDTAKTFVTTRAYQDAITSIAEHRFVILLGQPAVGKTAIASNICMTGVVEGESNDVVILNHPDEFSEHWNPNDPRKVYWFDDVFGATSLNYSLVNAWASTFTRLHTAIRRGATVIFTSRDYIFNEAKLRFKQSSFPLLFNAQVSVHVDEISLEEKKLILYNHIKHGDLSKNVKTSLKPFLKSLVECPGFTPELARRLGNKAFHHNLTIDSVSLKNFFEKPVTFFEEVIRSLDDEKIAALVLILLHGNSLPSPVNEGHMRGEIKRAYDVSLPDIKRALDHMKDSLVKLPVVSGRKLWSLYHPSMVDSLQSFLSKSDEMLEVFLLGSSLTVLLRDITCIERRGHKIFVPNDLWNTVMDRLENGTERHLYEYVAGFLIHEVPDEFLIAMYGRCNEFIDRLILAADYIPLSDCDAIHLCFKLHNLGVIDEKTKVRFIVAVGKISMQTGDISFLKDAEIKQFMGEQAVDELLKDFSEDTDTIMSWRLESEIEGLENEDDPEDYLKDWFSDVDTIQEELESRGWLTSNINRKLTYVLDKASKQISEYQISSSQEYRDEDDSYDYYRDSRILHEDSKGWYKFDVFTDVDE